MRLRGSDWSLLRKMDLRCTRAPETLPSGRERARCRTCHQYLWVLIIDGRYDSWECAGVPPQKVRRYQRALRLRDAMYPDNCRGSWRRPKRGWRSKRAAAAALGWARRTTLDDATLRIYQCQEGYWHLTSQETE